MIQSLKAPVVINAINTEGDAVAPALIWDGTGTASMFIQSSTGLGLVGVLFGPNEDMATATIANSFPVPFEGVVWKVGPATRYMSAIALDGESGMVVYYFEGQTEVTT